MDWLEIALAAAFVALAFFFAKKFFVGRDLEKRLAAGMAEHVEELLNKAIDQRGSFMIEFAKGEFNGRKINGICVRMDGDGVYIDIGREFATQQWLGEPVFTYFQFRSNNRFTYYQFSAKILKIAQVRGVNIIQLTRPSKLENSERRFFLRVTPQKDVMLGLGVWNMPFGSPLVKTPSKMPKARFTYRPGRVEDVKLLDISAAGLRLDITPEALQRAPMELSRGSQLLFLLMLKDLDGERGVAFWLAGRCIACDEVEDTPGMLQVRLKFFNWAINGASNEDINWFPVGKMGEVTPLANWIIRYDLLKSKLR